MDLSLSISTSGMIAQRRRLEVASQNLPISSPCLMLRGITHLTNGVKLSLSPMNKGVRARRGSRQR